MGDVEGRASLLEKAGQHELATLTREVHNLGQEETICHHSEPRLLLPPPPLIDADCPWPTSGLKSGEMMKEGYRDLAVVSS